MRIFEIDPVDVRAWAPRAVDLMARVRVASGALRPELVPDFIIRKTSLFRVGVPRDSRVFVNDENGDWMWLRLGDDPEVMASDISGDPLPWLDAMFEATGGNSVAATFFECGEGLAAAPKREISQRLMVPIGEVKIKRIYDDINVRGMTSAEFSRFLGECQDSSDAFLREAAGDLPARKAWDNMLRARDRLSDGVSTPGHALMSICVDSTVVGGIWAEIDGKNARIWNMYVYEGYRGHGHSQAALLAMADGLATEGVRFLHATVMVTNKRALDIYKAVGFKPTARHYALER